MSQKPDRETLDVWQKNDQRKRQRLEEEAVPKPKNPSPDAFPIWLDHERSE